MRCAHRSNLSSTTSPPAHKMADYAQQYAICTLPRLTAATNKLDPVLESYTLGSASSSTSSPSETLYGNTFSPSGTAPGDSSDTSSPPEPQPSLTSTISHQTGRTLSPLEKLPGEVRNKIVSCSAPTTDKSMRCESFNWESAYCQSTSHVYLLYLALLSL